MLELVVVHHAHKVPLHPESVDLLVIDESESIFGIVSSSTLHNKRVVDNLYMLQRFMMGAKNVVDYDRT